MRSTIVVAILALAALSAPLADSACAQATWDIFVVGGWVNSQLNDKDKLAANDQTVNGYSAGVGAQIRPWPTFGLELDVRYTQKGGEGKIDSVFIAQNANAFDFEGQVGQAVVELNYIEIPLLFSYILGTGANSWVRMYFGASVGILVSSNYTGVVDGAPVEGDLDGVVKNAEYSGLFGASFDYDFGSWQLLLDYRYVNGISGIEENGQDGSLNTETHSVVLGVGIPIGRED